MDLQTRKITFVRDFLTIQNEDVVTRLENYLRKQRMKVSDDLKPFSKEEYNLRILKFEQDSKNGKLTSTEDFIAETEKWD